MTDHTTSLKMLGWNLTNSSKDFNCPYCNVEIEITDCLEDSYDIEIECPACQKKFLLNVAYHPIFSVVEAYSTPIEDTAKEIEYKLKKLKERYNEKLNEMSFESLLLEFAFSVSFEQNQNNKPESNWQSGICFEMLCKRYEDATHG